MFIEGLLGAKLGPGGCGRDQGDTAAALGTGEQRATCNQGKFWEENETAPCSETEASGRLEAEGFGVRPVIQIPLPPRTQEHPVVHSSSGLWTTTIGSPKAKRFICETETDSQA